MTNVNILGKTSQQLWDDYYFLTKEMAEILGKQDIDLFDELMKQREALQRMIEEAGDDDFRLSAQGRELLQTIQKVNDNIVLKLQYLVNTGRSQQNVSRAYDGVGTDFVGSHMNRQT